MKISILAKTSMGKLSNIMMISSWVVFVVGSVLPWKPGYSGFELVIHNPMQAIFNCSYARYWYSNFKYGFNFDYKE